MTDRRSDVIQAAYLASEIAHRMVVPGGEVQLNMWKCMWCTYTCMCTVCVKNAPFLFRSRSVPFYYF